MHAKCHSRLLFIAKRTAGRHVDTAVILWILVAGVLFNLYNLNNAMLGEITLTLFINTTKCGYEESNQGSVKCLSK